MCGGGGGGDYCLKTGQQFNWEVLLRGRGSWGQNDFHENLMKTGVRILEYKKQYHNRSSCTYKVS